MASNVQNWFEEVVLRTNLKKNFIRLCQRQVKTDYLSINHSIFLKMYIMLFPIMGKCRMLILKG
jgi:hypothetical protein